ncbi:MAG TPA: hypothetical protein VJ698_24150 [Noviherbaspirillum sp.]|uniref:hypothetical protein n=1 Tax=Noviherbaspirillum sp. TaxID=1926288 RepID=UPI002B460CD2|nr:hypothetical protein [Noviherbaspirillum sp.]HJV88579.1 hypothetical protein [Noviherbaspirillum sp.]
MRSVQTGATSAPKHIKGQPDVETTPSLQQTPRTPPEIPVVPGHEPEITPPSPPGPEIPEPPPDPSIPPGPGAPEIIPEHSPPEAPPTEPDRF